MRGLGGSRQTALPRQAARHIVFIGGGAIGGGSGGKAVVSTPFGAAHHLNILEGHQQHQRHRWRQAHCSTSPSRAPRHLHWWRRNRRRQVRREYPFGAAHHLNILEGHRQHQRRRWQQSDYSTSPSRTPHRLHRRRRNRRRQRRQGRREYPFGAAHHLNILEGHQQHQRHRWRQAHCSTSPSRAPRHLHWWRRNRRRQVRREYPFGAAHHLNILEGHRQHQRRRWQQSDCSTSPSRTPHRLHWRRRNWRRQRRQGRREYPFGAAHRLNILEGHQQHQRRRWRQAHCSTSPNRTPRRLRWWRRNRRRQVRREYPFGAAHHLNTHSGGISSISGVGGSRQR